MRLNDVEHWLIEEEREILNNIVDADANRHYAAILHIASRLVAAEFNELMESLDNLENVIIDEADRRGRGE